MAKFRTVVACVVAGLLGVAVMAAPATAPAPDQDGQAKARLDALKKSLPGALAKWAKQMRCWRDDGHNVEIKLVRRISPSEAKITLLFPCVLTTDDAPAGKRDHDGDHLVMISLRYQDGAWTTTGYNAGKAWEAAAWYDRRIRFLLLAIDELSEK